MTYFNVGGRELALAFTMGALADMEETFGERCKLTWEGINALFEKRRDVLRMMAIMANQGEQIEGRAGDVTEAWLGQTLKPVQFVAVQKALLDAITEGMRMESDAGDPDEEVDVVLEEIKKKDTAGG